MIPYFPKQISYKAIITYVAALIAVSVFYLSHAMKLGYMVLGLVFVVGFFGGTTAWTKNARISEETVFLSKLFVIALIIRLIWVVVSYFFYIRATGMPFEFDTADAMGYHDEATWLAGEKWSVAWNYYFGLDSYGISDVGYPLYLTILYKLFGPVVIIPRIIKAVLSTFTCVLIYKLTSRSFGEDAGKMAGIMTALMPNLIIYCGYHLKETEMIFLEVAFLERMDNLMQNKKATFWSILLPTVLVGCLFFFRTVLGAAAIFAFATTILVSNTPSMKRGWKRAALIGWGVLCLGILSTGTAMTELESYWEQKDENVSSKRYQQTSRGNQWAKYATGSVMAPAALVLPFSTMIDVDQQYNQQEKHGGNFARNFMGIFAFLAIYEAFRRKKWRDFSLIGAFVIAYLGVVSLSGFSNSERFLLPALPGLIMMWAYGISSLRAKTYKLIAPWCVIVFLMEFAWAFFKLGSRGLF